MPTHIPFDKPYISGRELHYVAQAVTSGKIASDGVFTQRTSQLLERRFGIEKVLTIPSCTAALELSAMLCDLGPGDEVIMPSFTFVSTANAVVRTGARPVFVDIRPDTLNIDENLIEAAITPRTRAIFPVHYAGVACEMDRIMAIAEQHGLLVVEDAAQGVNAFYKGRVLGSIGHLGAYSFHATKNYICGEGGALCVNDSRFLARAEIIREKGTNRSQFFRGEVDKYTWVDVGSSYIMSEISCAFLLAQLEAMDAVAARRREIYDRYLALFRPLAAAGLVTLPVIPDDCVSNCHMFYFLAPDAGTRDGLLDRTRTESINAVFHYVPLHTSPMGRKLGGRPGTLPVTEDRAGRLVRLPFYYEITDDDQDRVAAACGAFLRRTAAQPSLMPG